MAHVDRATFTSGFNTLTQKYGGHLTIANLRTEEEARHRLHQTPVLDGILAHYRGNDETNDSLSLDQAWKAYSKGTDFDLPPVTNTSTSTSTTSTSTSDTSSTKPATGNTTDTTTAATTTTTPPVVGAGTSSNTDTSTPDTTTSTATTTPHHHEEDRVKDFTPDPEDSSSNDTADSSSSSPKKSTSSSSDSTGSGLSKEDLAIIQFIGSSFGGNSSSGSDSLGFGTDNVNLLGTGMDFGTGGLGNFDGTMLLG